MDYFYEADQINRKLSSCLYQSYVRLDYGSMKENQKRRKIQLNGLWYGLYRYEVLYEVYLFWISFLVVWIMEV